MRTTKGHAAVLAFPLVLGLIWLALSVLPRQHFIGAWHLQTNSAQGVVIYIPQKNGYDYQLRVFHGTDTLVYKPRIAVSFFGFNAWLYYLPPLTC